VLTVDNASLGTIKRFCCGMLVRAAPQGFRRFLLQLSLPSSAGLRVGRGMTSPGIPARVSEEPLPLPETASSDRVACSRRPTLRAQHRRLLQIARVAFGKAAGPRGCARLLSNKNWLTVAKLIE
jgi:hypothetical protein